MLMPSPTSSQLSRKAATKLLNNLCIDALGLLKDRELSGHACESWVQKSMSTLTAALGKDHHDTHTFSRLGSKVLVGNLHRDYDDTFRLDRIEALGKAAGFLAHVNEILTADLDEHGEGTLIFIGHGRSPAWKDLRDFLKNRLDLPVDEINRVAIAGETTVERLQEMLDSARFAFIVMTAEDEDSEGKVRARQNVVHEVGLFQGRLGFKKAIVLLEQGCEEFSNITGLSQIRFPKGDIGAKFEEIRRVLEREGLIPGTGAAF